MSDGLRLAVIFIAAVNPAAVLAAWAPSQRERGRRRWRWWGSRWRWRWCWPRRLARTARSTLDIAPETFRIAAGLVMLTAGAYAIARARVAAAAFEDGWKAGVSPLGLPLLLSPAVAVAALSYGADEGAAKTFRARRCPRLQWRQR